MKSRNFILGLFIIFVLFFSISCTDKIEPIVETNTGNLENVDFQSSELLSTREQRKQELLELAASSDYRMSEEDVVDSLEDFLNTYYKNEESNSEGLSAGGISYVIGDKTVIDTCAIGSECNSKGLSEEGLQNIDIFVYEIIKKSCSDSELIKGYAITSNDKRIGGVLCYIENGIYAEDIEREEKGMRMFLNCLKKYMEETVEIWNELTDEEIDSANKNLAKKTIYANSKVNIPDGIYAIKNLADNNKNKLLEVYGASKNNYARIIIWGKYNTNSQKWELKHQGDGYYSIKSVNSGKYLSCGSKHGNQLYQYNWCNGSDQLWKITGNDTDGYEFIPKNNNNWRMELCSGKVSDGTKILIWGKYSTTNQKWLLEPVKCKLSFDPNGGRVSATGNFDTTTMKNKGYDVGVSNGIGYVTVTYNSSNFAGMRGNIPTMLGREFSGWYSEPNGGIQVYDASGNWVTSSGYWNSKGQWEGTSDKTVYAQWKTIIMISILSNKSMVLDVSGGSTSNGAPVILHSSHGGNNQRWEIDHLGNAYFSIKNVNSGKYLTCGSVVKNQLYQSDWCNGSNQIWRILGNNAEGYEFTPKVNEKWRMDLYDNKVTNGRKIWTYKSNNTPAQKWFFIQPVSRTLTFDPNGGSISATGNFDTKTMKKKGYNVGVSNGIGYVTVINGQGVFGDMSSNIPTRRGYKFLGWYTEASGGMQVYDASGKAVQSSGYWDNGSWDLYFDSTVYAHWK